MLSATAANAAAAFFQSINQIGAGCTTFRFKTASSEESLTILFMTQSILESCNDDGVVAVKCGELQPNRPNYAVERHFRKTALYTRAGDKDVFHTAYPQLPPNAVLPVGSFGMESWFVNIICTSFPMRPGKL